MRVRRHKRIARHRRHRARQHRFSLWVEDMAREIARDIVAGRVATTLSANPVPSNMSLKKIKKAITLIERERLADQCIQHLTGVLDFMRPPKILDIQFDEAQRSFDSLDYKVMPTFMTSHRPLPVIGAVE